MEFGANSSEAIMAKKIESFMTDLSRDAQLSCVSETDWTNKVTNVQQLVSLLYTDQWSHLRSAVQRQHRYGWTNGRFHHPQDKRYNDELTELINDRDNNHEEQGESDSLIRDMEEQELYLRSTKRAGMEALELNMQ